MDEIAFWLLLLFAIVLLVFFAIWIALATALRVFAWVFFYWCVAFSLAAVAGLVTGLIIPFLVLSGRSRTKPRIATPDEVVEGRVITRAPRGFAKHFGWDRAWPEYNPYQAKRDAQAVRLECQLILSQVWQKVSSGVKKPSIDASGSGAQKAGNISASALKTIPGLIWGAIVPVPYAGFFVGVWFSFLVWYLMMLLVGGTVYVIQQALTLGYRTLDRGKVFKERASVICTRCYETNPRPSYRCPNPECPVVHHEVSPGPLGVIFRRCACGTRLPTTVGAASKSLVPLCPTCGAGLSDGSGARRTLQLPAFGAVGAGKTRFFSAALTAAEKQLASTSGSLEPLDFEAEGFLRASAQAVNSGTATDKTIHTLRPQGRPMKLTDAAGKVLELQLMDAAGESFTSVEATEELTYVNAAKTMVFVLDPLAWPRAQMEMESRRDLAAVLLATGDQEEAYASVVDRVRSEAVDLKKRHLAVVLTKTDILRKLPVGSSLDPTSSQGVREWLVSIEQDGFVRRIESDFGDVRYFAIDSLIPHDLHDPVNPLHVLQWVLQTQKVPICLVPASPPEVAPVDSEREQVGAR